MSGSIWDLKRSEQNGMVTWMVFIELILIDCFSVFVKCFYKYMVRELVR